MAREEITVGIVGLGLIGGSTALKLKAEGFTKRILGYDSNLENALEAVSLGIVDELVDISQIKEQADLIVLAIPVNMALLVLPDLMAGLPSSAVVIDFGSTKQKICLLANTLSNRSQYVACHPIAGTENTGPKAAFPALYNNKVNIVCDRANSSSYALELTLRMTETLGMRTKFMDSDSHDRHIAYVSHLSHISSFMLGKTVLEVEHDEKNIFDMAGSGFASTVRLAMSSPEMWSPIFKENAGNILLVLDRYINNLQKFKAEIEHSNEDELKQTMKDINIIRKVLEGDKIEV